MNYKIYIIVDNKHKPVKMSGLLFTFSNKRSALQYLAQSFKDFNYCVDTIIVNKK